MATWQTPNPITWFVRLVQAYWDAQKYLWDDQTCTWDAVSFNDDWHTANNNAWFTKN